jgi:hypothetical protein
LRPKAEEKLEDDVYEEEDVIERLDSYDRHENVVVQNEERFGFNCTQAFKVDDQPVSGWWMSPCMAYLIVKIRDTEFYSDDYNYYVKDVSKFGPEWQKKSKQL